MRSGATAIEPGRDAEIVSITPTLAIARYADVCIAIPRGNATSAGVGRLRDGVTAVARRPGCQGIAFLFFIAEPVGPPSGEARAAAREMFTALRPSIKAMAAILEGTG